MNHQDFNKRKTNLILKFNFIINSKLFPKNTGVSVFFLDLGKWFQTSKFELLEIDFGNVV